MTTQEHHPAPFIKWPGGKRALAPVIAAMADGPLSSYHEPFLGGGAVFFHLSHRIGQASLADAAPELVNAYLTVRDSPGELIELLQDHAQNHGDPAYYYRVRDRHHPAGPAARAARFLYLNRTCFNGLYRVNRQGRFNVARGSYRNPVICDPPVIMAASLALRRADIRLADFSQAEPDEGSFVYCDPPHHDTFAGYTAHRFNEHDQARLRDRILDWHGQGARVMCSNSDSPFVRNLYRSPPFHITDVTAPRYIGADPASRGNVSELIVTTYRPRHQPEHPAQPVLL